MLTLPSQYIFYLESQYLLETMKGTMFEKQDGCVSLKGRIMPAPMKLSRLAGGRAPKGRRGSHIHAAIRQAFADSSVWRAA